jgi:hypothetical protein
MAKLAVSALIMVAAIYVGWRRWEQEAAPPAVDLPSAVEDRQSPPDPATQWAIVETPEGPARAPEAAAISESPTASQPLGQLRDVGGRVKVSTAGLRYTPGSQEGHRVQHVLRHDNDQPGRPGPHGVFDGDANTLFAVIDEAYLLVQQGSPQVRSRREGTRTVHEVDLRRRIGFVGGRLGAEKRHPPATHVRLILEGDQVISAFPF